MAGLVFVSTLQETFQGKEWLLVQVAGVKLATALAPVALAFRGWPIYRLTRGTCWLGALVVILWGGLNTIIRNLVLAGLIHNPFDYDRPGMIGHTFMWDPLFLAWAIALAVGLIATRRRNDTGV